MIKIVIAMTAVFAAAHVHAADTRPDPADPAARSAPVHFDSGLPSVTRPAAVDPPARWREHNDRVRELGGHAGALRAKGAEPSGPGNRSASQSTEGKR
jgi:hypothetical protein